MTGHTLPVEVNGIDPHGEGAPDEVVHDHDTGGLTALVRRRGGERFHVELYHTAAESPYDVEQFADFTAAFARFCQLANTRTENTREVEA